jgi:hypothetical protein
MAITYTITVKKFRFNNQNPKQLLYAEANFVA